MILSTNSGSPKSHKLALYRARLTNSSVVSCSFWRNHRRSQDFFVGGGHPTDATNLASVVHTFEAVAGSRGSVSAPEVSRVMGGAPERNKNSKKI